MALVCHDVVYCQNDNFDQARLDQARLVSKQLRRREKAILMVIGSFLYGTKKHLCSASQSTIGKRAALFGWKEMDRRKVNEVIGKLVSRGLVLKTNQSTFKGIFSTNRYRLTEIGELVYWECKKQLDDESDRLVRERYERYELPVDNVCVLKKTGHGEKPISKNGTRVTNKIEDIYKSGDSVDKGKPLSTKSPPNESIFYFEGGQIGKNEEEAEAAEEKRVSNLSRIRSIIKTLPMLYQKGVCDEGGLHNRGGEI